MAFTPINQVNPTSSFRTLGSIPPNQSAAALGHSTGLLTNILSTGGAIAGGLGGAALGGLAGIETGPGALATGYLGGVAGSGLGGAAGEALGEKIETGAVNLGNVAKTGGIMAGLEAIGGPIASLGGKILKGVGGKLAETFIPTSAKEAGQLQAYKAGTSLTQRLGQTLFGGGTKAPDTAASTAFKQGLWGTESMMGIQAKRATSKIWNNIVSPALKEADKVTTVNMPTFLSELESKIIKNNPELTRQNSLLTALNSMKEDYAKVGDIVPSKLQSLKEGWAQFVPEKAYKGESVAGALGEVRNEAASLAREKLYSILGPEAKQAYLDYGNLQGVIQLGKDAMTGTKFKGGAGKFLHGLWEMATVPVGTIAGQTIYKVGQGIELMGPAGVKTVKGLFDAVSGSNEEANQGQ